MAKLEIAVLVGAESKEFLADLTRQIDRLEKLQGGKKTATTAAETEAEETTTISAKTVKAKTVKAKAAATKTKAAPAEEEDFDLGQEEDQAEETPAVTKKDLIAACRDNREAAIKILKKMKVTSVHDLKPTQYAKVFAEIGA